MPTELTIPAAFLVGLFGSMHCIGMCGGIAGALTMGLPESVRRSWIRMLPYLLLYNSGRIISYSIAGAAVGLLATQAGRIPWKPDFPVGAIVSGLFMIALGLYLAGWAQLLLPLERAGSRIWRHIEPLGRRWLPVTRFWQAFTLGLLWGWLPCGMVYAVLAWAMTTGTPTDAAVLMAAFGFGTLPMLFAMGQAARGLTWLVRQPLIRQLAGATVILFGVFMLAKGFSADPHAGHHHHHHHGMQPDATRQVAALTTR